MKRIIFFVYISTQFLNLGAMEQGALPHHSHDHLQPKSTTSPADPKKQTATGFNGVSPRSPKTEERIRKLALSSRRSHQSYHPRPNLKPNSESKTQF